MNIRNKVGVGDVICGYRSLSVESKFSYKSLLNKDNEWVMKIHRSAKGSKLVESSCSTSIPGYV